MNSVLIIDKPAGLTSHDVVNRLRRILRQRSIGHLGTLDPLATGVLPMVTGSMTRLAQFYTGAEKSYEGVVRFGFATDTYDAEGEPAGPSQPVTLDLENIRQLAAAFRGAIEQTPPPFSAKKINGVPAYKLARKKKEVVLQPVSVEIKEFEVLDVQGDRATFRARVSSGTYMRSIAHEMGQSLGCGAHLQSLRRTAAAEFTLADARTLEQVQQAVDQSLDPTTDRTLNSASIPQVTPGSPAVSQYEDLFVHPRRLLPQFPSVTADEANTARIRSGRPVNLPELSQSRQVKVFSGQRELIAIATRIAGTLFHAGIVFAP